MQGSGMPGICCTLQSDSSYLEWTHGIIQAIRNWTRGGNLKVVINLYEYKYCTHSVKRLALTRPTVMPSAMSRTPPPLCVFSSRITRQIYPNYLSQSHKFPAL